MPLLTSQPLLLLRPTCSFPGPFLPPPPSPLQSTTAGPRKLEPGSQCHQWGTHTMRRKTWSSSPSMSTASTYGRNAPPPVGSQKIQGGDNLSSGDTRPRRQGHLLEGLLDVDTTTTQQQAQLNRHYQLMDCWRALNLTIRDYTFYSTTHDSYSRLNYFLMPHSSRTLLKGSDILPMMWSDHNPLRLRLRAPYLDHDNGHGG
ncbi:Hypothetical predicted protein [Pelobates cultripes]|uniref:Uncharacterized protein n=1 Tax=Pelobates cultripes TaxID=61616 RepID=A0AAD1T8A1_PELCU|nr:Hypothetical predicted protein [Pelobates cultripes]